MAIIVNDRVRETTATTGTGAVTLAGAPSGFQTFNNGIGVGNQTYYTIYDAATGAWEVGIGTLSNSTTLTRSTVLKSSSSNTLVSFGGGSKDVFVTYPADRAVYRDENNVLVVPTFDNTTFDGSALETFVAWDSGTDGYTTYASGATQIHRAMRRCLLLDNGTVNYYLDPNDSTKKANGAAAVLTGADGMVMVEIPKFYVKKTKVSNLNTWFLSDVPRTGYVVHPAFVKNGVEVNYRYISAYDACVFDVSTSTYISGLNWDNNSPGNGVSVDTTATTGDKLASVSGIYPMVGLTRAEFRTLAKNRGTGWRQLDFYLWSAIQLLYLAEYGNFNSQLMLGAGNTNGSYLTPSGNQSDSPHTIAGASNGLGNNSTNAVSGAGVSAKPGTSFMNYRGIENLFGNCWTFCDGWNVLSYQSWVSNNDTQFADDTSTNYTSLGATLPTTSGQYITNVQDLTSAFLPSAVGGSSTTYITDVFYIASGNRVVVVGGSASYAAGAGAFSVLANSASSKRSREIGGRLAF